MKLWRTKIHLRNAVNRTWNTLSLSGFVYQVTAISIIYFNYEVDNNISIESSTASPLASSIVYPDYTVCFDTESLIDEKVINSVTLDETNGPLVNLTIEQIFKSTPDTNDLIESCVSRRLPGDYTSSSNELDSSSTRARMYSKSDCYKMYEVTKSVFEEHTCYKINPKGEERVKSKLRSIVYSGKWSRILYLFYLNDEQFDRVNTIRPLIHPRKTLPYKTYAYSPWFARRWKSSPRDKYSSKLCEYNSFKSSNMVYKIQRLGPPYESRCFNYSGVSFTGQEDCIQKCLLSELMSKLARVPFTTYIDRPIRMKQLSMSQLERENVSRVVQVSDDLCFSKCHRPSCFSQISITSGEAELYSTLRLIVFTPSSPDIIVTEEVAFTLLDYFIYLFSCFGSWWGLCWFTLNPIKFYDGIKTLHPRLHARCLTAKVDPFKVNTRNILDREHAKQPLPSLTRGHLFSTNKRHSAIDNDYNATLGIVASEMNRVKAYVSGEMARVHGVINSELMSMKLQMTRMKTELTQVTETIFGDSPDHRNM